MKNIHTYIHIYIHHEQVLRLVEKYIDARWEPWRDVVKNETKSLVVEVCEVYSISEKVLGDLIDRKQAQVCVCMCICEVYSISEKVL